MVAPGRKPFSLLAPASRSQQWPSNWLSAPKNVRRGSGLHTMQNIKRSMASALRQLHNNLVQVKHFDNGGINMHFIGSEVSNPTLYPVLLFHFSFMFCANELVILFSAMVFVMSFWFLYLSNWSLPLGLPDLLFLLLFPFLFFTFILSFTLYFGNPPGPLSFFHQILVSILNSLLRSRPVFSPVY